MKVMLDSWSERVTIVLPDGEERIIEPAKAADLNKSWFVIPEDGFFLNKREREGLKTESRIPTIKELRVRYGWSLKMAKEHVDAYIRAFPERCSESCRAAVGV